jgi:hypothetical protein
LFPGEVALEWKRFFPVAKAIIAQRIEHSLLSTYQHKYTLHRAIAAASAVLCWASLTAIIGSVVCVSAFGSAGPSWLGLFTLVVLSLFLVNVFAGSYLFFWKQWGNTVVTEAYVAMGAGNEAIDAKRR